LKFFTPDTSDLNDYYERGMYLLAWRISLLFSIIFFILGFFYSLSTITGLIPAVAVLTVTLSGLYYLKKSKNFRIVFWIFALSGSVITNVAMSSIMEFTHYVDFIWLANCILIAFIGLGKKEGLFFVILNCIGIGYFFFVALNPHIEILTERTLAQNIGDFIEVLFAFTVTSYLLLQFVKVQQHAEKELKVVNSNLEEQYNLISTKSNENETLIKEIHHRVKNNLQIIISLLRMQSQEMQTEEGKEHFKEAINRIMAMSLIHEKLYAEKELSKINLKSYLEDLTNEIISAFTIDDQKIELDIQTDIDKVNLNTMVPLGLLINELISNSLKHGLPNISNGEIKIHITKLDDQYEFNYADNGIWKESPPERFSFGVELIDILTDQMNGKKTLSTDNGTSYHFTLNDI